MNTIIEEIYNTRQAMTMDNRMVPYTSGVSREEGKFLYDLVKDNKALKTLEVGCAMGLSALHIGEALRGKKDAVHYVIDPFQMTDWQGIGLKSLERAGLREIINFMPELSEVALPALLKDHEGTFDLIFIDGWHTFDQTLLESYYGLRLLKNDGILVIDDCDLAGLAKVVRYISNYPHVKRIGQVMDYPDNLFLKMLCSVMRFVPISMDMRHRLPSKLRRLIRRPNMVALQKIDKDTRRWNWYTPF